VDERRLLLEYLDENDFLLYDFTNQIKQGWEHLGFMTFMTHNMVSKILQETMVITEIEEELISEEEEDYYQSDVE
jgi:hypothetical protein